jgi:DNA replication and repair protein RecF
MCAAALSRLTLSHFRSHLRAELRFDGRPTVLYGPNGAGKTNLLEAISLLSPGRGLRGAAAPDLARRPEQIGWRIAADLGCAETPCQIELRAEGATSRRCRIDGQPVPQAALGGRLRVLWLVPAMDRLWMDAAEARRRFLDRVTLSFFPAHAEASLSYDRAMRARNRLLRDQNDDRRWYAALEATMAEAGAAILGHRGQALSRLATAQAGAATAFPAAELALTGPGGAAAAGAVEPLAPAALAEVLARSRAADLRAGRSLSGPHRADLDARYSEKNMPAAQCSTGEQKALLISLVLANARALSGDANTAPVVLLDEVAAHLDADRRAALYDEVCDLRAQFFLSGTGPELFAEFGARADRLHVTERNGVSHIAREEHVPRSLAAVPVSRPPSDATD